MKKLLDEQCTVRHDTIGRGETGANRDEPVAFTADHDLLTPKFSRPFHHEHDVVRSID